VAKKPTALPDEPKSDPIKLGYARVSTSEQDLRMQRDALIAAGVDPRDIWEEKKSGATLEKRVMFQGMMKDIRPGDIVYVWKLDRLARNALDLYHTAKAIEEKGASLVVLTMPGMDTSSPVGKAMFGMLAVFAEFERAIALERTMAGLKAAKAAGRKGGRASRFQDDEILALQGVGLAEACARTGLSKAGFTKRLAAALSRAAQAKENDDGDRS
jgi:DNA invertase Pin-like site-specific DNA recombinase